MMEFQLDRDLVFLDLEATGLNVVRDRIIQIGMVKFPVGGASPEEFATLVNPGMVLISEEAYQVHGISSQDVARAPNFTQVAKEVYQFIGDADLAGYNSNRFDLPLLMEEFHRAGIDFDVSGRRMIDVQRIFYKMEPRTLKAALRYYCDQEMTDAHDAMADVKATIAVFKGQLEKYKDTDYEDPDGVMVPAPVRMDIQALHDFTNDLKFADATQKFRYDPEGRVVFNFGKHNGKPVGEFLAGDKNYYNWMLNAEFSYQVKEIIKREVEAYENRKK
jgi:DNA polymerase-3 subunit epsilon